MPNVADLTEIDVRDASTRLRGVESNTTASFIEGISKGAFNIYKEKSKEKLRGELSVKRDQILEYKGREAVATEYDALSQIMLDQSLSYADSEAKLTNSGQVREGAEQEHKNAVIQKEILDGARTRYQELSRKARQGITTSPAMIRVEASQIAREFMQAHPALRPELMQIAKDEMGIDPMTHELTTHLEDYDRDTSAALKSEANQHKFLDNQLVQRNSLPPNFGEMSIQQKANLLATVQTDQVNYDDWKKRRELSAANREDRSQEHTEELLTNGYGVVLPKELNTLNGLVEGLDRDNTKAVEAMVVRLNEERDAAITRVRREFGFANASELSTYTTQLKDMYNNKISFIKGEIESDVAKTLVETRQKNDYIRVDNASGGRLTRMAMFVSTFKENPNVAAKFVNYVDHIIKVMPDTMNPSRVIPLSLINETDKLVKEIGDNTQGLDLLQQTEASKVDSLMIVYNTNPKQKPGAAVEILKSASAFDLDSLSTTNERLANIYSDVSTEVLRKGFNSLTNMQVAIEVKNGIVSVEYLGSDPSLKTKNENAVKKSMKYIELAANVLGGLTGKDSSDILSFAVEKAGLTSSLINKEVSGVQDSFENTFNIDATENFDINKPPIEEEEEEEEQAASFERIEDGTYMINGKLVEVIDGRIVDPESE